MISGFRRQERPVMMTAGRAAQRRVAVQDEHKLTCNNV